MLIMIEFPGNLLSPHPIMGWDDFREKTKYQLSINELERVHALLSDGKGATIEQLNITVRPAND